MKKPKPSLASQYDQLATKWEPIIKERNRAFSIGQKWVIPTTICCGLVGHYFQGNIIFWILAYLLLAEMTIILAWMALEGRTMFDAVKNGVLYATLGFEFTMLAGFIDQIPHPVIMMSLVKTGILFCLFGFLTTAMANISLRSNKKKPPIPSL